MSESKLEFFGYAVIRFAEDGEPLPLLEWAIEYTGRDARARADEMAEELNAGGTEHRYGVVELFYRQLEAGDDDKRDTPGAG